MDVAKIEAIVKQRGLDSVEEEMVRLLAPGTICPDGHKAPNGLFADSHAALLMLLGLPYDESQSSDFPWPLFRAMYGWATPSAEALDAIVRYSPGGVIDAGCGNGYWSYLLRLRGVDVDAVDSAPIGANGFFSCGSPVWTDIRCADARNLSAVAPAKSLFLCWPHPDSRLASSALRSYRGDTVIYVGEGRIGCTAEESFFDMLDDGWTEVERVYIPTIRLDDLRVYTRNH